jgi:hypothetical protein
MIKLILFFLLMFPTSYADTVKGISSRAKALCPLNSVQAKKMFSSNIPKKKVEDFISALESQNELLGNCKRYEEKEEGQFLLHYKEAFVRGNFIFDSKGKLKNLDFSPPNFPDDSWEKVHSYIKSNLPPNASLYVGEYGKSLFSTPKEVALAISRNAQIFVYSQLLKKIANKEVRRTDLITLPAVATKSPFSIIQSWPTGTALTIDALLSLAYLEADSFALDLLVDSSELASLLDSSASKGHVMKFSEYDKIIEGTHGLQKLKESNGIWKSKTEALCNHLFAIKDFSLANYHIRNQLSKEQVNQGWSKQLLFHARDDGISQSSVLLFHQNKKKWVCVSLTANSAEEIPELPFSIIFLRSINLSANSL